MRTRRSITAPGEAERFAAAVQRLGHTPGTSFGGPGTRWQQLARVHGSQCAHGNWYFLAWHRAYVWHFEEACREALGDPEFTVPYWDWRYPLPSAISRMIRHRSRGRQPESISYSHRALMRQIHEQRSFEDFAGQRPRSSQRRSGGHVRGGNQPGELEVESHNYIHNAVGGHMGQVRSAALDPLFWLHHTFVDLLFDVWERSHGNYPRPFHRSWGAWRQTLSTRLTMGRGLSSVPMRNTLGTDRMGYRYEHPDGLLRARAGFASAQPAGSDFGARVTPVSLFSDTPPQIGIEITNDRQAAVGRSLEIEVPVTRRLRDRLTRFVSGEEPPSRGSLRLILKSVGLTDADNALVHVLINSPNDSVVLNQPHHLATFSFFHGGHDHSDAHDHDESQEDADSHEHLVSTDENPGWHFDDSDVAHSNGVTFGITLDSFLRRLHESGRLNLNESLTVRFVVERIQHPDAGETRAPAPTALQLSSVQVVSHDG